MFPEGGGLQECVLAQVNTVPGGVVESGREQVRAERAPICAPIPGHAQAHWSCGSPSRLVPCHEVTTAAWIAAAGGRAPAPVSAGDTVPQPAG